MKLISVVARNSVLLFCDLAALLMSSMLGYAAWAGAILHQPPSQYFHYCLCFAYSLWRMLSLGSTLDSVSALSKS